MKSALGAATLVGALSLTGCRAPTIAPADRDRTITTDRANLSQAAAPLRAELTSNKTRHSPDEPVHLTWTLTNTSAQPLLVMSHVATTAQPHFDNLELRIANAEGGAERSMPLVGPRKAAARIACVLEPGRALRHDLDLRLWSRLNAVTLAPGSWEITAVYRVGEGGAEITDWARCDDVSAGTN